MAERSASGAPQAGVSNIGDPAVRYRQATVADALAIATLHAASWRASYRGAYNDAFLDGDVVANRIAVWRRRMSDPAPNQVVFIAEEAGEIVGFACAYGRDDAEWGTLLDNLHVHAAQHRHGIGEGLIREVVTWCARQYAACGLYLWVLDLNLRARRFYERLGATDRGGDSAPAPGGGFVARRRYAWAALADVKRHASASHT